MVSKRDLYDQVVCKFRALPRFYKKILMICVDIILIPFALWLSLSLRLGEVFTDIRSNLYFFIAVTFFTIPIYMRLGLYRAVMRYVGQAAIRQIFTGTLFSAAIVLALTLYNWPSNGLPRSVFAIYAFVAFGLLSATRFLVRLTLGYRMEWQGQRVAIYGAGASGRQLVDMLRAGHEYRAVAFIDDNPELIKREVEGIRVYDPKDLNLVVKLKRLGITAVFLAIPSASRSVRRKILQRLEDMPFHVYTIPALDEIVSGSAPLNQLREVAIDDLLGRDPIPPNDALLGLCITSQAVMVTGAGGSIGSELCRQILYLRPRCLILYENSEFALFNIEKELNHIKNSMIDNIDVISVLGSVCDQERIERLIYKHKIETIYHAAAYKHVPIVEANPVAGISNNVFGTQIVANAANKLGVRHFVAISTDKAVRPTNVMGASKRLGELVLQDYASSSETTTFSMVRFGNVLGSSGSVVPLFRKQISEGGPVTVTHQEINRYFMTIQEAVQLVIQAGAMAKGGDVFVLDMGDPVKIYDLARQMINLSGLDVKDAANPDGDIEIIFTGLRPGEKLYEELLIGDNASGTDHPKIMRAQEDKLSSQELHNILVKLKQAIQQYDIEKLRALLVEAVSGYQPQGLISELGMERNYKCLPNTLVELNTRRH